MTTMTLAKALNAGLRRALEADPKVLLAGEDIGKLGGVFRVTEAELALEVDQKVTTGQSELAHDEPAGIAGVGASSAEPESGRRVDEQTHGGSPVSR